MADYEFPIEVKRAVTVAIADRLRYDKPAPSDKDKPGEEDHRRIVRMTLRYREVGGHHEPDVTEWDERDLFGKGIGIPTIVHGVELAACRDAAYRFGGDCIYVLAFHAKDYNNRSSFVFKIPGGQEIQHMALPMGRGGMMHGRGEEIGIAERLMPDILKYVSEKEARIEQKTELVFGTLVKQVQQLSGVVTDYTDRELKLREIAANAEDHQYEREKRHREDDAEAQRKKEMWETIKKHIPEAVPYVLTAIQRISGGPNGQAQSPEFAKWYAEQQRAAAEKAAQASRENGKDSEPEASPGGDKGGSGGGGNGGGNGADVAAASGEPSMLDQLKFRVAFDTSRFVALIQSRGKLDAAREALTDEQRALFDEIVTASKDVDFEQSDSVARIAGLSLMFGGAVQAAPVSGARLLEALDSVSKVALVELSNLLKLYAEAMQAG